MKKITQEYADKTASEYNKVLMKSIKSKCYMSSFRLYFSYLYLINVFFVSHSLYGQVNTTDTSYNVKKEAKKFKYKSKTFVINKELLLGKRYKKVKVQREYLQVSKLGSMIKHVYISENLVDSTVDDFELRQVIIEGMRLNYFFYREVSQNSSKNNPYSLCRIWFECPYNDKYCISFDDFNSKYINSYCKGLDIDKLSYIVSFATVRAGYFR